MSSKNFSPEFDDWAPRPENYFRSTGDFPAPSPIAAVQESVSVIGGK